MKLAPTTTLTTTILLSDSGASAIGAWHIKTTIHGLNTDFILLKERRRVHLYVTYPDVHRIGSFPTLNEAVDHYNLCVQNGNLNRVGSGEAAGVRA